MYRPACGWFADYTGDNTTEYHRRDSTGDNAVRRGLCCEYEHEEVSLSIVFISQADKGRKQMGLYRDEGRAYKYGI